MISLDAVLVEFLTSNYLTITVAFTVLKGLAKITPWAVDDTIVEMLFGLFKTSPISPKGKLP